MLSLEQERKRLLKHIEHLGIENRDLARRVAKFEKERERMKTWAEKIVKEGAR